MSKILFNLTGGIKLIFDLIYFILNSNFTLNSCKIFSVFYAIIFFLYRLSLVTCLFFKVKVILNQKERLLFGIFLLCLRIVLQIVHTSLINPELKEGKCISNLLKNLITTYGIVIIDFIIEIYLAFKVINFIINAKKMLIESKNINENSVSSKSNFSSISKNSSKIENYRIFNSVIFWFTFRIIFAILLNFVTSLNAGIIPNLHITIITSLNILICVLMSLFLTYSKDIIRYLSYSKKKEKNNLSLIFK